MINLSYVTGTRILAVTLLSGLWAAGCSSSNTPTTAAGATGGSTSTTTTPTGGSTSATGTTGGSTGTAATGGVTSAGSTSTTVTCGTAKSTQVETSTFATGLGTFALNGTNAAATVTQTTTSPASNATLCAGGCAAFTYNFTSGATAYGQAAQMSENYMAAQNLLGATITITLAVSNPSAVPIQIQLFAGGGSVGGYGWSNITTITGAGLTAYDAATGFSTATLVVADNVGATQQYCGSDTHSIGIQLQNTTALTADGSVTVYVQKIAVTPAP